MNIKVLIHSRAQGSQQVQQSLTFKRFFNCRETGRDGFVKDNRVSMSYMLRFLLEILLVVDMFVGVHVRATEASPSLSSIL